jgi:ribosomal protein S6--L-glutamate ligase
VPTHSPIVALVSGLGWHVEDLTRAARRLGLDFQPIPFTSLTGRVGPTGSVGAGGQDLARAAAVLVRMMPPGSLEQVVFRMDALHRLEAAGVPVVNPPHAVEAAVDKYLALARLDAAGLPVPRTWVGESPEAALAAFDDLGGDVVLKPLFGSEGRGMVRLTDRETTWRVTHALARVGSVVYLQEFVDAGGADLRALVLDGRVLGSVRRRAPAGAWRANVAQGARAESVRLDSDAERLALAAARAVGCVVAGVDLIEARDGRFLVVEVNAVPGWRALAAATGADVAAAILDHLRGLAP